MKVSLSTDKGNLNRFIGTNSRGNSLVLGANGEAIGPMESVLISLAGCSTIDVVMILKKMRQDVTDIKVEVDSKRRDEIPRIFTEIHLHYKIYGKVKDKKAEQAIKSSMETYCSVSRLIEKSASISSSFEVLPKDASL